MSERGERCKEGVEGAQGRLEDSHRSCFFWEDDEWLPLYLRAAKYLEIDRRAEVLNKRLDIIKELFDMLASELHNNHSNKLEWIVIILIMIEVFFQVVQLIVFHLSLIHISEPTRPY